ncbi:response regulator [Arthrobacter sp. 7Tela_A1]|uniref:response regulator n=1 Tax=Arthrobacter sp. 7Tela_A1 TaxID=3093745 RepID=UPI003BB7D976
MSTMPEPVKTRLVRTLVVDDDREVAGLHSGFLLAHGGFEVAATAHTGAQALEMIAALEPDLVLLDIHLPDMSGIEVLRAVRNMPGEPVDIFAITAARELETVRAAMAGGVLHYLVKPFGFRVLLDRLDAYVQARAQLVRPEGAAEALDQASIDRLLRPTASVPSPGTWAGLPKGLSEPTLTAVVRELEKSGESSASAVAAGVGLARVSARRYLEFLVTRGLATVTPRYGDAGRPEKFYRWVGTEG